MVEANRSEAEEKMLRLLSKEPGDKCVSMRTAARMINMSPTFVEREIRRGNLPALNLGNRVKIRVEALDSYLRQREFTRTARVVRGGKKKADAES